ncbi:MULTISPECIES: NUDIX hydrolase [Burkholderiaceae]|uniref:NUDIX hydrolase n=1 Tax=Burkholderiaceae TaxID=119060 RepID=UPI001423BBF4|nr:MULTISPECIES: NUDIX hydrolase [Burkholderiaceae]MBN3845587.1 NUDIX hydrolase [Paraburkholderia sp. Ac-20342]NIF51027.1 NUDIX hydrolase [Burkholderia sp. Ax-1724]
MNAIQHTTRPVSPIKFDELPKVGLKDGWLPGDVYENPDFVSSSILDYTARQLKIPTWRVIDSLFDALPTGRQTQQNRGLLEHAMNHSVNASGAVMMMVHTESGLLLVAANSQRRKLVVQTNGACEKNESIGQTAKREFFEELGNPTPGGPLFNTLDERNLRAINGRNQIGTSAAEIAKRIVDVQAKPGNLFLNVTGLYVNREIVPADQLNREVSVLNEKLSRAKPFYAAAVELVFGDKSNGLEPADLGNREVRDRAADLIRKFKSECSDVITSDLEKCFDDSNYDTQDGVSLGLNAVIDLSENDSIKLIDETSLASAIRLFESDSDALKHEFFGAAFASILPHKGTHTPEQFMALLKQNVNAPAIGAPIDSRAS